MYLSYPVLLTLDVPNMHPHHNARTMCCNTLRTPYSSPPSDIHHGAEPEESWERPWKPTQGISSAAGGIQEASQDQRREAVHTRLGERQTLERVEQQARITHGTLDLGTACVRMGFAATLPDTDAVVAACVAHKNVPGLRAGEIARFLDFTLRHQRPPVVSMEGLALLTQDTRVLLSSPRALRFLGSRLGQARWLHGVPLRTVSGLRNPVD